MNVHVQHGPTGITLVSINGRRYEQQGDEFYAVRLDANEAIELIKQLKRRLLQMQEVESEGNN